jgi:hypothetical protein
MIKGRLRIGTGFTFRCGNAGTGWHPATSVWSFLQITKMVGCVAHGFADIKAMAGGGLETQHWARVLREMRK